MVELKAHLRISSSKFFKYSSIVYESNIELLKRVSKEVGVSCNVYRRRVRPSGPRGL